MLKEKEIREYLENLQKTKTSSFDLPIFYYGDVLNEYHKEYLNGLKHVTTRELWRITLVTAQTGRVGIAICNPTDKFDKHLGKMLALGRALDITETRGVYYVGHTKKFSYQKFNKFGNLITMQPLEIVKMLFNL